MLQNLSDLSLPSVALHLAHISGFPLLHIPVISQKMLSYLFYQINLQIPNLFPGGALQVRGGNGDFRLADLGFISFITF